MDDTIFDHSLTCRAALKVVIEEAPYLGGRPLDDLCEEYGRLLGDTHVDVMLGRRSSEDARRERFRRLALGAGKAITAEEADELSRVAYAEQLAERRRR